MTERPCAICAPSGAQPGIANEEVVEVAKATPGAAAAEAEAEVDRVVIAELEEKENASQEMYQGRPVDKHEEMQEL